MVWSRNRFVAPRRGLKSHTPKKKTEMANEWPKQQLHLSPHLSPICLPTGRKWVPTHRGITFRHRWVFPTFRPFSSILEPRSTHRAAACVKCRPVSRSAENQRFTVSVWSFETGLRWKKSPFLTDDRQWIRVTFQWIVYNSLVWYLEYSTVICTVLLISSDYTSENQHGKSFSKPPNCWVPCDFPGVLSTCHFEIPRSLGPLALPSESRSKLSIRMVSCHRTGNKCQLLMLHVWYNCIYTKYIHIYIHICTACVYIYIYIHGGSLVISYVWCITGSLDIL